MFYLPEPPLCLVLSFALSHFHTAPAAALTTLKCCFCLSGLKRENEMVEASENPRTISVNADALHLLLRVVRANATPIHACVCV